MHRRYAIRTMRPDDREVSHANLARAALFNQAHPLSTSQIARVTAKYIIQKPAI